MDPSAINMFPDRIVQGDSVRVERPIPPAEDGVEWDGAGITLSLITSDPREQRVLDLSDSITVDATEGRVILTLTPTQTSEDLSPGVWKYLSRVTDAMLDEVFTFSIGITHVADPLDTSQSHERTMITIYEQVLQEKMSNRRDIQQYMIGDRNIITMSAADLRMEIDACRERLAMSRSKQRNWQEWRRRNYYGYGSGYRGGYRR